MSKVNMSTELPVGAEELWKVIGGFNALPDWHPGIKIENAPLPVANYVATIKVRQNDDGSTSTVDWSSEFEPIGPEADALATIQGVFQAGMDNLKKMYGG